MELEFSRQKLAENISALMQQKKLKIGEVEQKIGISTGYLSKMLKKETDAAPSTDIIWKLSKVLGVSTDMLIEGDFSKATDNLQYMGNFFTRLKVMTDANELEWDRISIREINNALINGDVSLPIIKTMDKSTNAVAESPSFYQGREVSATIHGNRKIYSEGVDADPTWVTNTGFKTRFNTDTDIYIFPMCCSLRVNEEGDFEEIEYFDIYFGSVRLRDDFDGGYQPDEDDYRYEYDPVCNTFNVAQDLSGIVTALYQSILRHEYDLKINHNVRDAISRFMNPDDPDNLPF